MICAIHQPNFFPWMGYFNKIARADVFVFLNKVDYEKSGHSMQGYGNRVSIYDENTRIYCPLVREHGPQPIDTVLIRQDTDWKKDVKNKLTDKYKLKPFFSEIMELVEEAMDYDTSYISEFNINSVKLIAKKLGIETKIIRQDELNTEGHSSELLVDIVNKVGCDAYLYGGGGSKYQDSEVFEKGNVSLMPQNYSCPVYKQDSEIFIPGLSILDSLFCVGIDETQHLIRR